MQRHVLVKKCVKSKPIPCAKICGISTTYQTCDNEEGFCKCPQTCKAVSDDGVASSQICRECKRPRGENGIICNVANCKYPDPSRVEILVCSDGRDRYCACFPTRRRTPKTKYSINSVYSKHNFKI